MGFSHMKVLHKKPHRRALALEKRDDPTCTLYQAPTIGTTVDSLQPLPIAWNSSCISEPLLDIYLISPTTAISRIHVWESVANSRGSYAATLMPRWWNATASQVLTISIVPHGQAPFESEFPAGPVFTATYTTPASGTPASADTSLIDSGYTEVDDLANKGLSPGKKAAAALLPLLFIIGAGAAAYVWWKRRQGAEKRKRWTEAVDKRMSTISTDWKSVSGAGANAAIRNSMAVGNRNSSFSFGALRPASTLAVEGEDAGSAGVGARPMAQLRTGVGLRNPAALSSTERVSRVSFAPDPRQSTATSRVSFADGRPSGESRRTRAFHSAYIPPVPALPSTAGDGDHTEEEGDNPANFSPRQTQGAMALTPEDIRAKITSGRAKYGGAQDNAEFADYMPALSLMRTGGQDTTNDEYLLPSPPPAPVPAPIVPAPAPTHPKPITSAATMASPVMSSMPMQPMPASVMSPDEMLRAYAERKKSMALSGSGAGGAGGKTKGGVSGAAISYPMPVASVTSAMGGAGVTTNSHSHSQSMRVLYDAATGRVSPTHVAHGSGGAGNGVTTTMHSTTTTEYTPSEYSAADAYAYGDAHSAYAVEDHGHGAYAGDSPYAVANQYAFGHGHNQAHNYDQSQAYAFGHHANASIGVGRYGGAQYAIGDEHDHDQEER